MSDFYNNLRAAVAEHLKLSYVVELRDGDDYLDDHIQDHIAISITNEMSDRDEILLVVISLPTAELLICGPDFDVVSSVPLCDPNMFESLSDSLRLIFKVLVLTT